MRPVFAMAAVGMGLVWGGSVRADGYHLYPTIPREVLAYDYTTGGVMMAPPVPYGHYAKDGFLGLGGGCAGCRIHSLLGCLGCGHGGLGHGNGGGAGGGHGCGLFSGHGHGGGDSGCGGGLGHHRKAGRFAPCDSCVGVADAGYGGVVATSQSLPAATALVEPSGQWPCGVDGCGVKDAHSHHKRFCGDPGCGLCGGKGKGCHFCGGKGCSHCLSALQGLHGRLAGLLHHQKVEYFVGAGGPVPLTPGYVPYIVATRSPRDFFAFPPMNPFDP
jgi:hypothetical protein